VAQAQREWFEKDYYRALGVSETATEQEIRRAYRKLAKAHHPDAHPGSEDRFKEISAAYDVLSDADKRKEYDQVRRLGPMAGDGRGFSFGADDLGDIVGNLFGRARRGGRAGTAGPQRGPDLEAELHLSFLDAIHGITTTVHLTSEAACHTCRGSGAAPGTNASICPQCGGRGVLEENQGLFSFSQACPRCGGRGSVIETPCPTCGGTGAELRARQVRVRVPAGVADGQRIRLKGRGGAGRNGGPPGDLFVAVSVGRHPRFGRKGRDLTLNVPVTFAEAALGAQISVPTLDGSVTLKIPPGTRSGKTFRVKGRGVPVAKGAGDLLVSVEVAVPQHLTTAEREAIEALAEATKASPREHLGA
jgi:molecular chaperone DnaJ